MNVVPERRRIVFALTEAEYEAAADALWRSLDGRARRVALWLERCWDMDLAPGDPRPIGRLVGDGSDAEEAAP